MKVKEFFDNGVYKFAENALDYEKPSWINGVSPRAPFPPFADFDPTTYSTIVMREDNPIAKFKYRAPVGPEATPGTPEHLNYVKKEIAFRGQLGAWQNSRIKRRGEIKNILNIIEMERHIIFIPVIAALLASGNVPAATALLLSFTPDIQRVVNFVRARNKEAAQAQEENPVSFAGNLVGQIYTLGKGVKNLLEGSAKDLDKYAKGGLFGAINSINKGMDGIVEGMKGFVEGPEGFRKKPA